MLKSFGKSAALAGLLAVSALSLGTSGVSAQTRDKVIVSSKIDTEGSLLGHMVALVLEKAGVPVEARIGLGPTRIVRTALTSGEIDIYPEYTGNGAFFHDRQNDPDWRSGDSAFALAKKLDEANKLVWLPRAQANNTWAIAVRRDLATREKLASMEDFAKLAGKGDAVKLAASAEFVESPAALPTFEKTYGFTMPRSQIVVLPGGDTAVTMRSAAQQIGGVNAAMVYGTDGAISALNLVVMSDPKGAQIVYEPAPVVRAEVLQRFPAMADPLAKAFGSLTLEKLQELNAKIAVEGRPARDVAREHLVAIGLLS
jgi:osmoprotectant transport system substrate-binding protein